MGVKNTKIKRKNPTKFDTLSYTYFWRISNASNLYIIKLKKNISLFVTCPVEMGVKLKKPHV